MSEAPRRFFKEALAAPADHGFGVMLDGRPLRTPAKARFLVPTLALAKACAAEWAAQGGRIDPQTMPMTRLANVAIDRAAHTREDLIAHVAGYIGSDLLAHRALMPVKLIERQRAAWDPLVAWALDALGVRIAVVFGVAPADVDAAAAWQARNAAAAFDDFRLIALAHAAGLAGSAIIAFALVRGRLSGAEAFEASQLDDLFSLEVWGEDDEARARLTHVHAEFQTLACFLATLE